MHEFEMAIDPFNIAYIVVGLYLWFFLYAWYTRTGGGVYSEQRLAFYVSDNNKL